MLGDGCDRRDTSFRAATGPDSKDRECVYADGEGRKEEGKNRVRGVI